MVGKWHLGKEDQDQPNAFGFNYECIAKNVMTYYDFTLLENNNEVYKSDENDTLTDRLTVEEELFVKKNQKKSHFFLYLAHLAPHLLLQPKPQKLPFTTSRGKQDATEV